MDMFKILAGVHTWQASIPTIFLSKNTNLCALRKTRILHDILFENNCDVYIFYCIFSCFLNNSQYCRTYAS